MEQTKSNSVKWIYLMLLLVSFTVTFMTRFIWSPLIPTVTPILSITAAQAGAYMSAFYIGYVITQIPGGVLSDKYGAKYTLSLSMLIGGLATLSMSFISTYSVGFIFRLLTGIGAGSVMACCSKVIADKFEESERGVAFGILFTGPTLGLLIANKLGAALLNSVGWQGAFKTVGIIALVIGILIFFCFKTDKTNTASSDSNNITLLSGIKTFFSSKNLICVGLGGFFYLFVALGTATWANAHLARLGFKGPQGASVMMLYSLGGIAGSLITGFIVKKFNLSQRNFLVGVYIGLAAIAVIFGRQSQLNALKLVGFLFGFFSYLPNAHLNALTVKFSPKGYAGSVMGVQNFIFQLASIASPIVLGWTIDVTGSFSTVWYSLGACPIVGLLFLLIIKESANKTIDIKEGM